MRHRWMVAILLASGLGADDPANRPAAKAADVESIDAIVGALYDVISGAKGEARDFDRMRSLFAPGARLIPVRARQGGGAEARVLGVEEFIGIVRPAFEDDGFFESEIARQTQAFGNFAHVFSTYESRRAKDQTPFVRGINSIQLLKDKDRWWIVTISWESERPGNPIPAEFLPKDEAK